jgi:hypothetical protein
MGLLGKGAAVTPACGQGPCKSRYWKKKEGLKTPCFRVNSLKNASEKKNGESSKEYL